jgi:TonB family protein
MKWARPLTGIATLLCAAGAAAGPLEDFQLEMRRSEGIMAYRVVADTVRLKPHMGFFDSDREVASAAVEGDLRERWMALLSSGFEEGTDCATVCVNCEDRVRYRFQFPPLSDSLLVSLMWDDHRAYYFRNGIVVAHRTLTASDTAWAALLHETFPSDTLTQMLSATDPRPPSTRLDPRDTRMVGELPEIIRKVEPHYPPSALMRGEGGTVLLQALVGPKGRVLETRIVTPASVFDESARVAVEGWRFRPARCGGDPVTVWVLIPIRFTFQNPGAR